MKPVELSRQQRVLVNCAPIDLDKIDDRAMRSAVFRARGSEPFLRQQAFDKALAGIVETIPIPAEVSEWFSTSDITPAKKWSWKKTARNPALISVAVAMIVIGTVFSLQVAERLHEFPGAPTAKKLLAVAASTKSVLLDPMSVDAGTLGDLFFMKHQLEHYDVPSEFADFRTIGARVFDDEDSNRVAQIWVVEKKMQFFLFPAERDPKTGAVHGFKGWRNVEQESWSGIVREKDGVCFMAALRGRPSELSAYLTKGQ
jgi:hypothetical protein